MLLYCIVLINQVHCFHNQLRPRVDVKLHYHAKENLDRFQPLSFKVSEDDNEVMTDDVEFQTFDTVSFLFSKRLLLLFF